MKTQSINLYNKLIDPSLKNNVLNLRQLLILNSIVVAMLLVLYSYQYMNVYFLKKQNTQLITDISLLESSFYQKKKQYPQIFFSGNIDKLIQDQSKELEALQHLLNNISNYDELSNYLTTFSRVITKNAWINAINITKGGDIIKIAGQSITNGPMNTFFENILNDKELDGYTLNVNNVSKDQNITTKPVSFEIELSKRS